MFAKFLQVYIINIKELAVTTRLYILYTYVALDCPSKGYFTPDAAPRCSLNGAEGRRAPLLCIAMHMATHPL